MFLPKYLIGTLGKTTLQKKNLSLQTLSLNVKFQATYTTKLIFYTLYEGKKYKLKVTML